MKVADGQVLLKVSDDKVSAIHGDDKSDYSILEMYELFTKTSDYLNDNFSDVKYAGGFYDHSIVTALETGDLTEEEWLDYRRGGIGGSDVSIIYGVSHFRCNRDLYYDKLGIKPLRESEDDNWLQKEMGHVLEDLVAKVFAKKTGLKAYEVKKMFSHPLYPFMRADVDRFVTDDDGCCGILEFKTTNYQNKDAWAGGKYPYQYELQIRHYMAVMNLDFTYIACLWGNSENDFAYRKVERDYDFEDEINCRAIAPHAILPAFLDDRVPEERALGLKFGLDLLKICKKVVVCGTVISEGMQKEIEFAQKLDIPVIYNDIPKPSRVKITIEIEGD